MEQMRLAVSSFAAVTQSLRDVEGDLLKFGLDVEIMCEPPHAWPAPVPWANGHVRSLHAPILGINIASTNPGIRKESVMQILATIREAARLGAAGVVVHPGIPPYQEVMPRDRGLPFAIESLRRMCRGRPGRRRRGLSRKHAGGFARRRHAADGVCLRCAI